MLNPAIEKARQLFGDAGLTFPTIPEELAPQLKELGPWLFATRQIDMSPYNLDHYVQEVEDDRLGDYALLSHSGHGVNSYAIQYYLVRGPLRLFLHLGWGGVYADAKADAAMICDCFSKADRIVAAAHSAGRFLGDKRLMVVGSDFYGSYWLPAGKRRGRGKEPAEKAPAEVLTQALDWLSCSDPNAARIGGIVGEHKRENATPKSLGQRASETKGHIERVRAAKMAAWTRKNGKNDALNPHSKENFHN